VPLAVPSTALAERWLRPVPGEVARSFDYARTAPFARGAHRGADLAAPPGATVRAACGGRVVHAGPVAGSDAVVSVRCGARRVSYLPLAAVSVRAGASVRAGSPLGTVAAGHGGLHVGVRREADPFGYEDPLALLPAPPLPAAPVVVPGRRPRWPRPRRIHPPRPLHRPPARAPTRRLAPRRFRVPRAPAPRGTAPVTRPVAPPPRGVAPWPVWLGLALLLCGAAGSGTIAVRRRRRATLRPFATAESLR
jgi:murein DD-endopeptidase MepM/ murein hydrolase activator NlpD